MLLCVNQSVLAQTNDQLQLSIIGNGAGPYYAPAGQITQLKIQILNLGPGEVFLVRGEVFLDPNLSGNWQLVHSEDTGNFHLAKLESAVWTFDLKVPSQVQALNVTNGMPQVEMLVQIVYSTPQGPQQSANEQFLLSVPGAGTKRADYSFWLFIIGLAVMVLVAVVLVKRLRPLPKRRS
jgi:hypothetical protein